MSKYSEKVERRRREAAKAFAYEPPERLAEPMESVSPGHLNSPVYIDEIQKSVKFMQVHVGRALAAVPEAKDCTGAIKMDCLSLAGMLRGVKVRLDAIETRVKSLAFAIALQEAVK